MIAATVRFRYENGFDEARLRQIAESASGKFKGMPGLRSKAFTVNPAAREALNFYIWETETAARAFYTPENVERIGGIYGVRPTIEYLELATLVENMPA